MALGKLACAAALVRFKLVYAGGSATCPCITSFSSTWEANYIVNNNGTDEQLYPASVQNSVGAVDVYYDAAYGLADCQAWDHGLAPYCDGASPPSWCSESWCYVDPASCIDGEPTVSVRNEVDGAPYYSYKTCGTEGMNYAKFERTSRYNAADIRDAIVLYLRDLRDYVETQMYLLDSGETSLDACNWVSGCSCANCVEGSGEWTTLLSNGVTQPGYSIDFNIMTLTHRGGTVQSNIVDEQKAECLSSFVEAEFKRVARQEYTDPSRLGFLYYGEQEEGVYFGWPGSTLCSDFDPRYRPWYVSAVSGPKDVVLVIDRSGSMFSNNRWTLATQAVRAVLDTLTEYDFFAVILFSQTIEKIHTVLVPATPENKDALLDWIGNISPGGGTDFALAFSSAFALIDTSRAGGSSSWSGCNGIVLFLTDGADESGMTVDDVADQNTYGYAVFTYTLGDNAADQKPRDIACANGGVYTHVPEGGAIANTMSSYFEYFATDTTFSESGTVRWTEYDEVTTNREVITGCLPAYDRTAASSLADLHGVVCFDVGLILTSSDFKLKPDYASTWASMEASSRDCVAVRPSNADLDELRARTSSASVCSSSSTADAAAEVHGRPRGVLVMAALLFVWPRAHVI